MTDRQHTAKQWLNRVQYHDDKLKAERRTLEMLADKLYKGVSSYEHPRGHADAITAQASHEDMLIDYGEQISRYKTAAQKYIAEIERTRTVLEQIPAELQGIAIDRYINGLSWEKIEGIYCYCQSSLYRLNLNILDNVAEILSAQKTDLTTAQARRTAAG